MADENVNSCTRPSGGESGFEASSHPNTIDLESPCETESDPSIIPLTSRHTSEAWKHYKRKRVGDDIKAECNYCQKYLAGGPRAGTSHLKDHTKCCPKRLCKDLRQTRLFGTQVNPVDKSETLTLAPYEFHQDHGRHDLAEMIILHEYPLNMVEHYGFRKFCKTMQPGFKVPCRNTTRKDIMTRYGVEKGIMSSLLEKTKGKIALTTDMWTSSNQKKGYMAVTAHFIDNSWNFQSRILRFLYVEAPHTKDVLADALCKSIYDWNLDCRISSVTLDNCTTNDALMSILRVKLPKDSLILRGRFLHMRCCAHILNLIVQDGLTVIGESIERVRKSVVFWTSSLLRIATFEKSAKTYAKNCSKKLVLDCKTRWNSTYEMLKVAIMYKNVFNILSGRESDIYKCAPLKEDWEQAERICEKLSMFSEATHDFSGTKYPTANVYFTIVCDIRCALNEWIQSTDPLIKRMASIMLEKYNKYWSDVNTLLAVAAVLDPRYKMAVVSYYYNEFYVGFEVDFEVEKVKDLLRELVSEYSSKYGEGKVKDSNYFSKPPTSNKVGGNAKLSGFVKYLEVENQGGEKSELEKYLEAQKVPIKPNAPDNFDILTWWKTNGSTYPILQMIARDILGIPASSVASESAFSTGGRVLSQHRSRLLPSTVEALMCAQNWIWTNIKGGGELKEVEYEQLIEEIEEVESITDDEVNVD
ncbi:hypothetical protein RND81_01G194600 [Saponaria officinalis]|uniref:BED-type domain-containing protein n=1 Tax=Saponaria officinalis TaxID=3572 RepID=A0AAW1NHF2_SAPOF